MNKVNEIGKAAAVKFAGEARVHIGLASSDLSKSEAFYATLLNARPTKKRPGYVKFETEMPSLNLTLNAVGRVEQRQKGPAHFGVQVKSTEAVQEAIDRLNKSGIPVDIEESTTCCYAVQNKVWASDPDGNRWEVFVVLEKDAEQRSDWPSECCPGSAVEASEKATCC